MRQLLGRRLAAVSDYSEEANHPPWRRETTPGISRGVIIIREDYLRRWQWLCAAHRIDALPLGFACLRLSDSCPSSPAGNSPHRACYRQPHPPLPCPLSHLSIWAHISDFFTILQIVAYNWHNCPPGRSRRPPVF